MRHLKNILRAFVFLFPLNALVFSYTNAFSVNTTPQRNIARIAVIYYDITDTYIVSVKENLIKIENENPEKVKFSFYDSKNSQENQNRIVNSLLDEKLVDVLCVQLVTPSNEVAQNIVNKCKSNNIPLILLNDTLDNISSIQSYGKSIVIATDSIQSGILQGELVYNLLNKGDVHLNSSKILNYIMLEGVIDDNVAINRTYYSISTLNNLGIKTNQLSLITCNWSRECAKMRIKSIFIRYGTEIELIIANNDAMALGAIDALQEYGYNLKGGKHIIPVVGIDAIKEAQEAIKEGIMSGTVLQKPSDAAQAMYIIGLNLFNNKPALQNTRYKYDEPNLIRLPYYKYEP